MPVIDLTRYIVASTGPWTDPTQEQNIFDFTVADTMSPERLLLRWAGDFVALTGPLRVRVTVQAENMTVPLALVGNLVPDAGATYQSRNSYGSATMHGSAVLEESIIGHSVRGRAPLSLQASTIYSYTLDIPAGQAWAFSLAEQLATLRLQYVRSPRLEQLGNNLGFRVIIEPAFVVPDCAPVSRPSDLPCDFASVDRPNTASFFPVACEPCEGSVIGLPPSDSVALVIPPAEGGCVRTRFFNGMFITREDLETEQRYHRLKSRLHNRAAGAGVVWGLRVGKQGSQVCVMPGYGVDCCGNDLALTSTYKVEIAALMADPAAASLVRKRDRQGLHLLLEYVECPSDPRPVHGDVCSSEASRCEMSRLRESVRLRLVEPCDEESRRRAPIQRFLDEVRDLQTRYPIETHEVGGAIVRAPFQMQISVGSEAVAGNAGPNILTVRPSAEMTSVDLPRGSASSISVKLLPDPLWSFVRGRLSGTASGPNDAAAGPNDAARPNAAAVGGTFEPADSIDLALAGLHSDPELTFRRGEGAPPREVVIKVAQWQAQTLLARQDDPAPSGDLTFTVRFDGNGIAENSLRETPILVSALDIARSPCSGDPCAPKPVYTSKNPRGCDDDDRYGSQKVDPARLLTWLHADPQHPSSAGDPKVLLLAALGGWLSEMTVREQGAKSYETISREQGGKAYETSSTRRQIAEGVYRAAWMLLFGMSDRVDSAALGATLQRLLEAWCDGFLWNGPLCCCDPHGVVIGCAIVEGGTIQSIDPFAGRRHVVHYPLLEHWGKQFGIASPDAIASRFFSKLCCLAGLPANGGRDSEVPSGVIAIGEGYLGIGDPKKIHEELTSRRIGIVEERKAGTPEMIAAALTLIGTKAAEGSVEYVALILDDFVAEQTVMLLKPR